MKNICVKNTKKIRNYFYFSGIIAFAAVLTGFGPMFFGPGLTNPEPFDLTTDTAFSPTGTATDPYEVAYPNLRFDSPITFSPVPNQAKIVVGQLDGKVFWIGADNNTAVKQEIIDLSAEVGDRNEGFVWDGGFLGLAIHPDFGTPGKNFFFIYYTTASAGSNNLGTAQGFSCNVENFSGNYLKLERFEVDPISMNFIANSRVTMINRRMYNTTHRGGGMEFGDDGFLYLSTGDQAAYINAQELDENLDGGVLRLDVDMIGGGVSHAPIRTLSSPGAGDFDEFSGVQYFIPNDNPFPSPSGATFEEYYSIGHRNPHRMTKDRATGTFYIGEVGENNHEEINVLGAGNNYGWPLFEANVPFNPGCAVSLYPGTTHTGPLVQFAPNEANSITGGYVYRGSNIPELVGKYICADYGTGDEIWQVDTSTGDKQLLGIFEPLDVISFGQDVQGELYFLKLGDNVPLYRLTSSITQASAPATLSATGAFTNVQNLEVADGFIPYEMIDPFWSDGAYKTRWMAIPNDGSHDTPAEQIQWSENGDWGFPIGSVIIKHFDYPIDDNDPTVTRKIETRFSIKSTNGNFYFLTYKWRPDESDADLVDMTVGDTTTIPVTTVGGGTRNVNWLYPSNSQCISCHSPALGGTLGPRTRFLNKDFDYSDKGGTVGNQLVTLSELGILNQNITDTDTPGYLTHKAIDDPNATLDEKARSYLDNNCAYCHQPATGNRADFDLRLFNTLSQTGLLTAGINQTIPAMAPDQQIVFPGDASKSQLYHRANSLDPGIMMPPLAKGIVDTEGVALLEAWINQLQAPAPLPAEGDYRIVNRASGETLQVSTAGLNNGANVDVGSYEGLTNQHFALEERLDGFFELRALHSNRYVDVQNGNTQPNANVWQYQSNGSVSQTFELLDAGDGTFNLVNKISDYFLGQDANGNVLVVENDGSDALRWEFLPTSAPFTIGIELNKTLVITNEEGLVDNIDVSLKAAPTEDVVIIMEGIGNTDEYTLSDTEFTFTPANWDTPQTLTITGLDDTDVDGVQYYDVRFAVDNTRSDGAYAGFEETVGGYNEDNEGGGGAPPAPGIYRIINVSSGLSIEVLDSDIANSANIEQGLYQAGAHEQFELRYEDNGLYSLIAQHSGRAVDVQLGNPNPGTNIWQFAYNGTVSQLWTIQDAGNGSYHIISDLGGHYLGIEPNGNISVNVDDGGDVFRWEFKEIQTPGNGGVLINKDDLFTDEDGDTDTFTVVLTEAPTATVTVGITVTLGADEVIVSTPQLTFDQGDWDVPQIITVTGLNDDDVDGIQDYIVEAAVIAPIVDVNYDGGVGDTVAGLNYDNDGGNGAPRQGIYRLQNVGNTESLMSENGGLTRDTNFVTGTYNGFGYQHFELLPMDNDLFSIKAIHDNLVVDIEGGVTAPGTNVWMYTGNGNIAQLFEVVDAGDGTYFIISILDNGSGVSNYLTVEPDGNVIVDVEDGSDNFRWRFLPTGFPPEAIATADITGGNEPLTVQFTGSASNDDKNDIVDYFWDFGNGDTSMEQNPTYTFAEGGSFEVLLTVTDGDGYTDQSDMITINVNGGPTAVASSNITGGNSPLEVSFIGDQSFDDVTIISYDWNFGDSGNSTVENPVHTFNAPGTYNVTLTVTDDGGLQDTTTLEIVVNENEAPVAVASANIMEGNAPLDVTFTGDQSTDDIAIATYSWNFGDGTTSNLPNPTHTFSEADVYNVTLTVTDDAGLEDTESITITVNDPNGGPIAVANSDISEGSAPLEVNFSGDQSTDDQGIVLYSWDFGDGSTSEEINPSHVFDIEGQYQVILTVADANGQEDTDSILITVNTTNLAPQAVATSDISTGDAPLQVAFAGEQSTDDMGIVSYNWDFGDGTSSTEVNPNHTYTNEGNYIAMLLVTDAEGLSDSASITITVNGPGTPVAVIGSDLQEGPAPLEVSFTGDQSSDDIGIESYNWDFGDGNTSGEPNPVHVFNEIGEYVVILTVTDGDGLQSSDEITIIVNEENVIQEEPDFEFVLAPNPTTNYVDVVMSENFDLDQILGVMLHDMSGRLIRQFMLDEVLEGTVLRLPTNTYRNEVYVVTVMFANNEPVSKRLVIN